MYPGVGILQGRSLSFPLPTRVNINIMAAERVNLYWHMPPQVWTILLEGTPFPDVEPFPNEDDITCTVRRLRLNPTGGPSDMREEHLHKCLRDATREYKLDNTNWRMWWKFSRQRSTTGFLTIRAHGRRCFGL